MDSAVGQGVERLTQPLEPADAAQGVAALEQGPLGLGPSSRLLETPPDRLRSRLQADNEAAFAHRPAVLLGEDDAAAGGDNDPLSPAGLPQRLTLAATASRLAL